LGWLSSQGVPRRLTGLSLATLFLGLTRSVSALPPAEVRYEARRQETSVDVPRWNELERRLDAPAFPAAVDEIVHGMSLATYDLYLRQLSGHVSAPLGTGTTTFQTRYSLNAAGQQCWQYAFERLQALGYAVAYDPYTRSGQSLKNIVATIPGEVTPERIYVLGGHIDSMSEQVATLAPGAEDNASGASVVLAAAAALAGRRFESTIELVLFSGEEQGLWGSQAYVSDAISQGRDIRAAVTCDMVSYHTNEYGVLIEGESAWASLMQTMAEAVDTYTTLDRQFSYFSFGSDHVPFQDAGIPAILCIDLDWDEYPWYHRTTDTYVRTDPVFALEIGRAALATVSYLAVPREDSVDVPTTPAIALGLQVTPNPAWGAAFVSIDPARAGDGPLLVLDARGRVVRTIDRSNPPAGTSLAWDLTDRFGVAVRSGVYWLRVGPLSRPLVVVR
jgi:hypothetical protein